MNAASDENHSMRPMGKAEGKAWIDGLEIGGLPRVVGTVSRPDILESGPLDGGEARCDLIEARLDQILPRTRMAAEECLDRVKRFEAVGTPAFATVRTHSEGGAWEGTESERGALFEAALARLSGVDVELRSGLAAQVADLAARHRKALIVSYHDFDKTPGVAMLKQIVLEGLEWGTVVKVATMVHGEEDIATLTELLRIPFGRPICIIGMGASASKTRTLFPAQGSCFTYGYLDVPCAPGQMSAAALVEELRRTIPQYAEVRERR